MGKLAYLPYGGWKDREHKKLPRGLRNNNPLNIRYSTQNQWQGQMGYDQPDGGMCVFSSMKYGYRAAFKLLQTYQKKYGCNNVGQLIARWAPQNENNTKGYIKRVCDLMHCEKEFVPHFGTVVDYNECITLLAAMAMVENGVKKVNLEEIERAHFLTFGWRIVDYAGQKCMVIDEEPCQTMLPLELAVERGYPEIIHNA